MRGGPCGLGFLKAVLFFFMWGAVVGRVKAFPSVLVLGVCVCDGFWVVLYSLSLCFLGVGKPRGRGWGEGVRNFWGGGGWRCGD